jgi:hypothetical protein
LAAATVVGVLAALLTWLAPFWLLKESHAKVARLREELDAIEQSRPKVELHSIRQAQLYRPLYTAAGKGPIYSLLQVWFKNQPTASTEKAVAQDAAAEITFSGSRSCRIYGQWTVGNPPDFVGSDSIAPTVDIPPGPLPVKLNLALKYQDDSYAYGFSQGEIPATPTAKTRPRSFHQAVP